MVILTLPVWTSDFNHVCSLLLAIPSPTPHIHKMDFFLIYACSIIQCDFQHIPYTQFLLNILHTLTFGLLFHLMPGHFKLARRGLICP